MQQWRGQTLQKRTKPYKNEGGGQTFSNKKGGRPYKNEGELYRKEEGANLIKKRGDLTKKRGGQTLQKRGRLKKKGGGANLTKKEGA